jgi:hypothetical protein
MKNYGDFKEKAKYAVETIIDVSTETYRLAEAKAKMLAKKAKLNANATREKSQIRRMYIEIGKKYYELHKDDPGEAFKDYCDSVTESYSRIESVNTQLEELKNAPSSCDCDDELCCEESAEDTSAAEETDATTQ